MDSKPIDMAKEISRALYDDDKKLYSSLVFEIGYDPLKSLQILSFWIWLEQCGFNNALSIFLSLPKILLGGLAEDAVMCLECINHAQFLLSPAAREISLTQRILGEGLSLLYLHENRDHALWGVGKIFNEIYARALSGVMAIPPERNEEEQSQEETVVPPVTELDLTEQLGRLGLGGQSSSQGTSQQHNEMPLEDRTMFVAFSRRHPVAEWEISEFITMGLGNCIESIQMDRAMPYEQRLYARVVFISPAAIDTILQGMQVAKFSVNGKEIWITKNAPANTPPAL